MERLILMGKSLDKFHELIGVAVFAALGTILMFFEFPVLFWLPFLKIDLSDVVTLIGTFAFVPVGGTLIALIKSMVHVIVTGSGVAGLIGNGSAFVGAVSLLLPFNYFWKKGKKISAIVFGTIVMTIVMSILNYFVVMPLYMNVIGMKLNMSLAEYVATGVVPFNIVKALIISIAVMIVYPRIKGHFAIK
ncbi:integral membrane protein [Companilactobacillus alimentarius DSM 20249]|nr:integral membrane protein [Companilactobacillus alimentarius DSM 20249]